MIHEYQKKAVVCGNQTEVYEYARPIFRGLQSRIGVYRGSDRVPKPRTTESTLRTRKKIRQLVNSNPTMDKFLTLTFAENVTDIRTANYEFKKFRQKLERHLGRAFKYLGVIEFQERGAVHYHLMMDIPFIEWQELSELWGKGRIKIERIRKANRAGLYMAKTTNYLLKGATDTRLFGKKVFFYSYNLLAKARELLENISSGFAGAVEQCSRVLFKRMFFIEGHGLIKYTLYENATVGTG